MARGYQIFARSQKFRDNFDQTFRDANPNPCKYCHYLSDDGCLYDGDCIALEKETANEGS